MTVLSRKCIGAMCDYDPFITKIENISSAPLRAKGEQWKPNKKCRALFEQYGYKLGETIANNETSKIKKAHYFKEHTDVAVKIIKKHKLPKNILQKFVPREISLLQHLQHQGIVDLYEAYESPRCIYLVMELLPGGDLLQFVNDIGHLQEADARRFFHQLLDIVTFLHENNVCHRDIKLENLMLDDSLNIKITDFGFARYTCHEEMLSTACGSYVYTAPEVMDGEQYCGIKADIWSVGVCLYAMLCGRLPFRDEDADILRYSMREKLRFYRHISRDCRHLLRKMLDFNPEQRPSVKQIRRSDWMRKPIKNVGQYTVSSMSVAAALSEDRPGVQIDPTTEHGFNCHQHGEKFNSTKVTDMLRCVSENHSIGTSSINIRELPLQKATSVAITTGVTGPVGRRISQQLGLDDDAKTEPLTKAKPMGPSAKAGFGRAMQAMITFKRAATVIKAVRRFRRRPLNTILNMSQEDAMAAVMDANKGKLDKDSKQLHRSTSGKVAVLCKNDKEAELLSKKGSQMLAEQSQREHNEKEILLFDTMARLLPPEEQNGLD